VPAPVVLEGRHVRLEPLTVAHVPALVDAADEDRTTYRYTLVTDGLDAMTTYVRDALAGRDTGSELPFATCSAATGAVVGATRFLDLDHWNGGDVPTAGEIGHTWLAASAQRTAINTEAKLLMLSHAFETWDARRIHFKTDARNERSGAAIIRLGAHLEGVRRAHLPAADGAIRDSAYYSILAAEWPGIRDGLLRRLRRAAF
jgi:RimJ/RimL family protein N-acetyltransferase